MKDGRFKIRIAIAHNKETRYFVTDCCVSSEKNFKNGQVTGKEPGAREMNIRINAFKDRIQRAYDLIEGVEYFTCSEVVDLIKEKLKGKKPKTILEIMGMLKERKILQGRAKNTLRNYDTATGVIIRYFGETKTIQSLTEDDLLRFKIWMGSVEHKHHTDDPKKYTSQRFGMTTATQREVLSMLKAGYMFAQKQRYFVPEIDIWDSFEMPQSDVRLCCLQIEELRRLRDATFADPYLEEVRDLLMLSFYLCGMNLADVLKQDLSQPVISYRRIKTINTRPKNEITEFTIQPEARAIINRFWKDGKFTYRGGVGESAILSSLKRKLKDIKTECQIEGRLIYYSMRKTFSQLCLELGVPDTINAYCIGDTPAKSALNSYRMVNRQLADTYIRKVFDFVASNKSTEEALAEIQQQIT